MKKYLLLFMLVLVGIVTPVFADGARTGMFMSYFDMNGDGVVTFDEFSEAAKFKFGNMDSDKNGSVNIEEFQAYVQQRRVERKKKRFEKIDTDKDGSISMQDYISFKQKKAEQRFLTMDTNNDAMVSLEEFTHFKKQHHGKGKNMSHRGHRFGKKRFFSRFDTNNDNKITLQESITAWSDWFNRIDGDHNQIVTQAEVQAYRNDKKSLHR